jgi:hypothetical protein
VYEHGCFRRPFIDNLHASSDAILPFGDLRWPTGFLRWTAYTYAPRTVID